LRQANENGILTKTFDLMPGNDDIIFPAHSKNTVAPLYDESQNFSILTVKFKVTGTAKSCTVTQIDNFQLAQILGATPFHAKFSP
jgi:hypothetical protein